MTLLYKIEKSGVVGHVFGEFECAEKVPDLTAFFHNKVFWQYPSFPLSERHLAQYDKSWLNAQLCQINALEPDVQRKDPLERAKACLAIYCARLFEKLGGIAGPVAIPAEPSYLLTEEVSLGTAAPKRLKPVSVEELLQAEVAMVNAARVAYKKGDLDAFVTALEGKKLYLNPFELEDQVVAKLTAAKINEVGQGFFIVNALGLPQILSDLRVLGYSVTQISL